ncbi:hypothetical protein HYS31_01965 [Candidatus Woesearchaeota archaeon]|nr:hypothetical protein [Candidatus Woesearchaeota archaeon]
MKLIINECLARIRAESPKIVSKEMGVFYNHVMSLNRDISILLLNSINKSDMQIADPLAASGVRSIRFLKELKKGKLKKIFINDHNKAAVRSIKENLSLNNINVKNNKIEIKDQDANLFLLNSKGFDYIDIDPFGSPNFLLNNAIVRLARNGILAVTATDTSALCGTFPNACVRKYWAVPKKGALMHEIGLRILIRKVQLVAAQFDKALVPIFSYAKEHYMRVFLKNNKGKNKADEILKLHGMLGDAGPMWLGRLWYDKLASEICSQALKNELFNKDKELIKFLKIIKEESKIDAVGFYDAHDICEKNKIGNLQKKSAIIEGIRKLRYSASETHFKGEGIRSNIPYQKLLRIMK